MTEDTRQVYVGDWPDLCSLEEPTRDVPAPRFGDLARGIEEAAKCSRKATQGWREQGRKAKAFDALLEEPLYRAAAAVLQERARLREVVVKLDNDVAELAKGRGLPGRDPDELLARIAELEEALKDRNEVNGPIVRAAFAAVDYLEQGDWEVGDDPAELLEGVAHVVAVLTDRGIGWREAYEEQKEERQGLEQERDRLKAERDALVVCLSERNEAISLLTGQAKPNHGPGGILAGLRHLNRLEKSRGRLTDIFVTHGELQPVLCGLARVAQSKEPPAWEASRDWALLARALESLLGIERPASCLSELRARKEAPGGETP